MVEINNFFKCKYILADATASRSVNFIFNNYNPARSNSSLLVTTNNFFNKVQTDEHNFSVLDGSFNAMSNQTKMGFLSLRKSDDDGTFENVPSITAEFKENHSSVGFTLGFVERYPLECEVTWYSLSGVTLANKVFDINSNIIEDDKTTGAYKVKLLYPVENYSKVIFKFTKTIPGSYIKINSLLFGVEVILDETVISSNGKLISEIDRTGSTLPISTLSFDFIDLDDSYNFGNNTGIHLYVQTDQKLYPIETINGKDVSLGVFYIKEFSVSEGKITISAQNIIGQLDSSQYLGSEVYLDGITIQNILANVLEPVGFTEVDNSDDTVNSLYKYKIDSSIDKTALLYGTIKPQSTRNALKEIVLAIQAIVYSDNDGVMIITKPSSVIKNRIGTDIKISTKVTKNKFVSGTTVNYSKRYLNIVASTASANDSYTIGDHTIKFNEPYDPYSLALYTIQDGSSTKTLLDSSVAKIIEKHAYYVIIRVYEATKFEIDGIKYGEKKFALSVKQTLLANTKENVKSYNSTLCNHDLAVKVAKSILNYYNYRLGLSIQYLANNLDIDNWNIIQNPNSQYSDFIAMFNSITVDLTNGFVVDGKLVGVYNYMNNYVYAGDELIADNNALI